jgi:hypothetical protein
MSMSLLTGLIWAWAIMVFGSIGLGLFAVRTLGHGEDPSRSNQGADDPSVTALNRATGASDMRHEMAQMRSQLAVLKMLLLLTLMILAALLVKAYGIHL